MPTEAAVDVAELLANVEDAGEVEVALNDSPIQAGDEVMPDGPVSYTHLRAHETVLDLVCRLLLEKKTIHNDINTSCTQEAV